MLTPGIYNSAYFEHSFLAQRMGVALVEGRDLFVGDDDCVYMRTIDGPERVDVIYRRIDDLFLDPEAFRPDSALGVPGLLRAWKAGNVGLANAPGAGVADDKVVYAWVPDIIRYYLGEEPLIPNVPTYRCFVPRRAPVRDRQHRRPGREAGQRERRLRPAHRQPGDGRASGPTRVAAIEADPRNWVAQPILDLSSAPTLTDAGIEPRHLDLRPFILTGRTSYVTKGGLTRVALPEGLARRELVAGRRQQGHLGRGARCLRDGALRTGAMRPPPVAERRCCLARAPRTSTGAGRYLERVEDTARIVREHTNLIVDLPTSAPVTWEPLLAVIGDRADFDARHATADEASILRHLVSDTENPGSILRGIEQAREDLRTDPRGAARGGVAGRQRPATSTWPPTTPTAWPAGAGAASSSGSSASASASPAS